MPASWVRVTFEDAGPTYAQVRYRLLTDADALFVNIDDVIINAQAVMVALGVLTWDAIPSFTLEFDMVPAVGIVGSGSANNQVHAYSYTDIAGQGFDLPAWDDGTFDKDEFNLLSPAYNVAASVLSVLLRDAVTGDAMGDVARSISRSHKSRGKQVR